ncbi:MAG: SDR family NAD(P)-dependent oxidoreductase [Anaerolineae bacterium]|nr:SDR family NAD(P)-dependent oxidoreductase [Anaerolineae bacterium]
MTTLVTGGAGFVGSHIAEKLLQQGERVVVLDNFNDYYDPALKRANAARLARFEGCTIIEGDVRDRDRVPRLFAERDIQRVAHLAAMAGVRFSVDQAFLYAEVNTMGTLNLLEAARQHGTPHFVFASTSSVYGATSRLPFTEEDTADRPLAAYPASKRSAELLGHTYTHLFGMNFTALRLFNVYGPAAPDMMPLRLMHAITRGEPITIFNNGNIHRDWTYIDDTVQGILAALDRPLGYEVINLGVGHPISLSDFITTIEQLAGKTAIRHTVPTPLSDPPITFCNNEKARRLLGFDPQVRVQDGLAHTWAWFCQTFTG